MFFKNKVMKVFIISENSNIIKRVKDNCKSSDKISLFSPVIDALTQLIFSEPDMIIFAKDLVLIRMK